MAPRQHGHQGAVIQIIALAVVLTTVYVAIGRWGDLVAALRHLRSG